MALTLQQIRGGTSDRVVIATVDTLKVTDQVLMALPWQKTPNGTLFGYERKIVNPAASFVARGGSISNTDTLKIVPVDAKTKRVVSQQSIDRSNAQDAGGLGAVRAKKVRAAVESIGLTIGNKLLNGDTNLTAALNADSTLAVSNGFSITNVGPNITTDRGEGALKYTHSGTLVQFRAPGDYEYGDAVAVGTNTVAKVYSYNGDSWVEVTHGSQAMSADGRAIVTFSGGTNEFDGIFALLLGQTSRVIYANSDAANGANVALTDLDRLEKMVKAPRQDKVFILSDRTMTSVEALIRAAGGATMMEYQGTQVSHYKGIPLLYSDYMPTTQTRGNVSTCTSVICTTLGEGRGLVGYYTEEDPEPPANARIVPLGVMGLTAYDLGMSSTLHDNTVRVVGHVALAMPNTIEIAQLGGVLN